jgi:hypothetical protein
MSDTDEAFTDGIEEGIKQVNEEPERLGMPIRFFNAGLNTVCPVIREGKPMEPKRVTTADVLATIKDEEYFFAKGDITTICVLTLQNGRQVAGVVHGQVYNKEIGKAEAKKKAIAEIWPLLVYKAHCDATASATHQGPLQK